MKVIVYLNVLLIISMKGVIELFVMTNVVNDYDTKKFVFPCTSTQYWSKVGYVTYCLSKCTNEFG